jgi:hypothetical protein
LCDDGNLCTADTCQATSGCTNVAAPATACRSAGRNLLNLRHDPSNAAADRLTWKWSRGAATTLAELGDPTAATDYALCVYDATGPVLALNAPADPATWRAAGSGFNYEGTDGVRVSVRSHAEDRAKARIHGRGTVLPDPALPLVPPVTAQLINSSNSVCFESAFDAEDVRINDGERFKAR